MPEACSAKYNGKPGGDRRLDGGGALPPGHEEDDVGTNSRVGDPEHFRQRHREQNEHHQAHGVCQASGARAQLAL